MPMLVGSKRGIRDYESQGIIQFKISGTTHLDPWKFPILEWVYAEFLRSNKLPVVALERDPNNPYDKYAIKVMANIKTKWIQIGWVPTELTEGGIALNQKICKLMEFPNWSIVGQSCFYQETNCSLNVPIFSFSVQFQWK